jgi:hypothetical protein
MPVPATSDQYDAGPRLDNQRDRAGQARQGEQASADELDRIDLHDSLLAAAVGGRREHMPP